VRSVKVGLAAGIRGISRIGQESYRWLNQEGRPFLVFFLLLPLFSFAVYLLAPFPRERYYLAFPDAVTGRLRGEVRYAPARHKMEARAESILREILLGPQDLKSQPILSRSTRVRSVLYRKGRVYADIGSEFAADQVDVPDFRRSLALIASLVEWNLPGRAEVILTVDGHIPYEYDDENAPPSAAEAGKQPARASSTASARP